MWYLKNCIYTVKRSSVSVWSRLEWNYSGRKIVRDLAGWKRGVKYLILCIIAFKYGYVVEEGEGEEGRAAAEAAAATAAAAESFWLMVGIGMDNSQI